MTNHGILLREPDDGLALLTSAGQAKVDLPLHAFDNLLDLAQANHLTHLWLHPSTDWQISQADPDAEEIYDGFWNLRLPEEVAGKAGGNTLISFYGRRRPEFCAGLREPNVYVIFQDAALWQWADLSSARTLQVIAGLEARLGVAVSASPANTGYRYLVKLHPTVPQWFEKPEAGLAALPWKDAARPLIWSRTPEEHELQRGYLVAYDKNSAYPRAAVEESFGVGEPIHVVGSGQYYANHQHQRAPGMWHIADLVQSGPQSSHDVLGSFTPPILWKGWERSRWMAAPLVRCLLKHGYSLKIDEGYVFLRHANIFEGWAKNLWGFRQDAATAGDFALEDAYKAILNDTLGLTGSEKVADSAKFRPDQAIQVVAGARAAMHYNIQKFARTGHYPVAVYLDALYFTTDNPHPADAVPGILDHRASLGGYKLKWLIRMDDEVRWILAANMALALKLQRLNAINEQQYREDVADYAV